MQTFQKRQLKLAHLLVFNMPLITHGNMILLFSDWVLFFLYIVLADIVVT